MRLCIGDHIEKYLLWYGYYEKKEMLTMQSLLNENSIVIDIGANIGYFSMMAAHKCAKGKIYSFEPASKNFRKLEEHIKLNNLDNVFPYKSAISDKNELGTFFISDCNNSGMSGLRPAENFSGKTELINCIRLDNAVDLYKIRQVDLVKIDTEGSEMNVLEGMIQVITKQHPILLIEISAHNQAYYGQGIDAIFNKLYAYGYRPYKVIDANVLDHVSTPCEAELLFFIPSHYLIPETITVLEQHHGKKVKPTP